VTNDEIPRERDLPSGRLAQMKDDLMAHIDHDIDQETEAAPPEVPLARRPLWRRTALVVAAAAAALGITAAFVATGDDSATASPNFAEPTDDGFIRIHIKDLDDPEQIEQDLAEIGVPAVVDIHEGGGYRCDTSRSDGWATESTPGLFPTRWEDVEGDGMFDFRINPDALRPGETVAMEFFWDEHDGEWATYSITKTSMSPVGECELVEDDAIIVDAEAQIVGG
jgi:hypothetical protein